MPSLLLRVFPLLFALLRPPDAAPADTSLSVRASSLERLAGLRGEAELEIREMEPLVDRLARMRRAYAATCRLEALSAQRESLRSDLLSRHLRLASVKKSLFDLRRTDVFLSLAADQRPRRAIAAKLGRLTPPSGKPPAEEADSYFVRSFDATLLGVLEAGDKAWRAIRADDAAFKAAREACEERRSRRIPLYAALAGLLLAAIVVWRFAPGPQGPRTA